MMASIQAVAEALAAAASLRAAPAKPTAPPAATAVAPAAGPLTHRELEVAALLAQGASNRQIAERLFIAERTAANHVQSIMGKLGLHSRAQVALWAVSQGLHRGPPGGAPPEQPHHPC